MAAKVVTSLGMLEVGMDKREEARTDLEEAHQIVEGIGGPTVLGPLKIALSVVEVLEMNAAAARPLLERGNGGCARTSLISTVHVRPPRLGRTRLHRVRLPASGPRAGPRRGTPPTGRPTCMARRQVEDHPTGHGAPRRAPVGRVCPRRQEACVAPVR